MIAIIDVTGNNLTSLANAIKRLEFVPCLTHDPQIIKKASHVILPGVGTAGAAMEALKEHQLIEVIRDLTQPLLGICVGMQVLFEHSEENEVEGLGLLSGKVERLPSKSGFSIPHMGWNQLQWRHDCRLQQGLEKDDSFYFVHSYAVLSKEHTVACSHHTTEFSAVVQEGSIYGVQFHPEKSAHVGLQLLKNFLNIREALKT
jgi:glutamine amidotransferase